MTFEEWWYKRWDVAPNKHYAMITQTVAAEAWAAADRAAREECADICDSQASCEGIGQECAGMIRQTIGGEKG
jgi:hypothetical protein